MRWAASAAQSVWQSGSTKKIDVPFEKLGKVIRPKGGNMGVTIAGSGVGKTTFLANWTAKSNMRTLYMSSDTSAHDFTVQLGALSTDDQRVEVERRLMKSATWRREYGQHIAAAYPNLVVDFDPQPSIAKLDRQCHALTELWGVSPEMVVMDTATNVEMSDRSNNAEWQRVWLEALQLARDHNLFFMFAHHVKNGPARTGRVAPELSDGLWGSDVFPEFVLGLHLAAADKLTCTVRKNRTGQRDVTVHFNINYARGSVTDLA